MPYKRNTEPHIVEGEELASAMIGIGMNFAGEAMPDADIEDTLISASLEGISSRDYRTLSVLTTWLDIHASWINVDRLVRSLRHLDQVPELMAYWAAIAQWKKSDPRFAKVSQLYGGPRVDLVGKTTDFQVGRNGEDPRFVGSSIRVPDGTIRHRRRDAWEPSVVATKHTAYRWRVTMGPSYRADIWSALELNPELNSYALAQLARSSYETARQVRFEWEILNREAA